LAFTTGGCNAGYITGRYGKVFIYGLNQTSTNAIPLSVRQYTLNDTMDLPDASNMTGRGFKSVALGLKQLSGTITIVLDESVTPDANQALCVLTAGSEVQMDFYPDCQDSSLSYHVCCAVIQSVTLPVAVDETVTLTFSFVSNGCYFSCNAGSACSTVCADPCS
jgi:hypothetical protein